MSVESGVNADAGIMEDFHALTGQSLHVNRGSNHIPNSSR